MNDKEIPPYVPNVVRCPGFGDAASEWAPAARAAAQTSRAGTPVVPADWSSMGWLVFSGLEGNTGAYRRGTPATVELALPWSYTFAAY